MKFYKKGGIFLLIYLLSCSFCFAQGDPLNEKILELEERVRALESKTKNASLFNKEDIELEGGATFILQTTNNANGDNQSPEEDVTDGSFSVDLILSKEFNDYAKGLIHLEAGQGQGVEDELKVFSNVNRDADNDENVRLTEIWYEYYLNSLALTITMGKLDPTAFIDNNEYANDETTQFLGRIFRNSPVIEFADNSGGFRIGLELSKSIDSELVVLDADADWEDAVDGLFIATQFTLKPEFLSRAANYRLIGWFNDQNHTKWLDSTKDKEPTYGFGISLDQELAQNLGAFVRFGWQNPDVYLNGSDFSLEQSYSLGLELKGMLWGREGDKLAMAIGEIKPSDDYKKADNARNAKREGHFECYYNYKLNEHLTLSPDLQIIWNPYGKDASVEDETIIVFGLRGQLEF
ncbi:MAG: hypothetical protein DRP74_03450 [Candidatus Omnitrophota bacterium]|nr:MAG: hypothetical protein DRP74_03450 [Candidatus Omnitrophota bacterium]